MEREDTSYKRLLFFSLPSILSSLLEPLSAIVDTAFVGQVSTEWLGGLTLAVTLVSSFTWMFNFLVHASTQSVAASLGSGADKVSEAVKTGLVVALFVGVGSSIILWISRPILFKMIGVPENLYSYSDTYFSIRVFGHCSTLLYLTLISTLRGLGRVNISFFLVALTTTINALISYLAVFVFDWGLAGVAWGTIGSFTLGTFVAFFILINDKSLEGKFFSSKIKRDHWFQFGKNSLNIFGRSFSLTASFFISTRIASSMGLVSLASHQILLQVWLFCSFLLDGVAITGTVLGAKYYAKGELAKIRIIFRRLLELGAFIGIVFTLIYFLGGAYIVALFTKDILVLNLIFSFWAMVALSQTFNSVAFVYDGLLFGLEEFSYLRKHMIIGVIVVFLPFAFGGAYYSSLSLLWGGMIALNIYRGISGFLRIKGLIYA